MPCAAQPGWYVPAAGRFWLLITGVLLLVGIVRNINLLALLGSVLLAVFALQALTAGRGLRRLQGRRWCDEVLRQGVPCRVEIRLINESSRPAPGVWIEDTVQPLGWYIDRVEGHGRYTCRGEVVPERRGWFTFGSLLADSGYPFGLVRKRVEMCPALEVLVLPRPGKLSREQFRRHLRGNDPRGERSRQSGSPHELARADFHGLRPYRLGDSLRWVHWRTSARRGQLMVKEFEDVPGEDLLLVFDPDATDEPSLEQAVSLATTIVDEWCQRRGNRLIVAVAGSTGEILEGVTGPELARRALKALAVVQRFTDQPTAWSNRLADRLRALVPRSAAAVVVGAGPSALVTELETALGRAVSLLDARYPDDLPFYRPPEMQR
ncbi:MAG: DUF58 domain-containing protein [Gemmataceae bacterium]